MLNIVATQQQRISRTSYVQYAPSLFACYPHLLLGALGWRRARYLAVVVWTFRRSPVSDWIIYSNIFIHFYARKPDTHFNHVKKSVPTSQGTYFACTRKINHIRLHCVSHTKEIKWVIKCRELHLSFEGLHKLHSS